MLLHRRKCTTPEYFSNEMVTHIVVHSLEELHNLSPNDIYEVVVDFAPHNDDLVKMFYYMLNIVKISFTDTFDTTNIVSMVKTFRNCENLREVDMHNINTANLYDVTEMFCNCFSLTTVIFGNNFNTHNVINFGDMFNHCIALKTIDVSTFDTTNAFSFKGMFSYCRTLETVIFGNGFTAKNVRYMSHMFEGCLSLKSLHFPISFETDDVVFMNGMFKNCSSLEDVDVRTFNTKTLKDATDMFDECKKLKNIDLSGFDFSNVEKLCGMFRFCESLKEISLNLSHNNTLINLSHIFAYCTSLTTVILDGELIACKHFKSAFKQCYNLAYVNFCGTSTSDIALYISFDCDYTDMFCDCANLMFVYGIRTYNSYLRQRIFSDSPLIRYRNVA